MYFFCFQNSKEQVFDRSDEVFQTLNATRNTLERNATHHTTVQHTATTAQERADIQAKLVSLELQWAKLQWECEGRNMRLVSIHELLHLYKKSVVPFLVSVVYFDKMLKIQTLLILIHIIIFTKKSVNPFTVKRVYQRLSEKQ